MGQGQGYNSWIGIGVQSTLGTLVARTKFLDFISEGVKLVSQKQSWNTAGETAFRMHQELGRHSEGPIEVYGQFEGLESLFKAAFGASSVTSAVVSGTAYGHTYALKDAMPAPGLSLEINRDVTAFLYEAAKIDEVEIMQGEADYLKIRFNFRARNETQVTASTPTFVTPLEIRAPLLAVKVATVLTPITSFRISIKNNLTGFRAQLGSGADSKEFIRAGKRSVTGTVSLTFEDVTRYNEFRNNTDVALEFKYTGGAITGGLGETYIFKMNLPKVNWDGETPEVKDSGPLNMDMPFTATETTRSANDEMALFIENTLTSVT